MRKPTAEQIAEQAALRLLDTEQLWVQYKSLVDQRAQAAEQEQKFKLAIGVVLKEIRRRCKHERTVYHGDASGNNDSWYECEDCGAEVPKYVIWQRNP